jgi:ribosome recycling factor
VALTLQQQQQELNKLKAELSNLKSNRSRLLGLSKGGLLKKPDPTDPKTIQIAEELATVVDLITTKEKEYNALQKAFNESKADTKVTSKVGSAEELRKAAEAGYAPNEIQQYRDDLASQLKNKKDKKLAEDNAKEGEVQSQELTNELATAGQFIARTLDDQGRVDLAAQLNAVYGTNLPLNGKYSPDLKAAYTRLLTDKFTRSLDEGKTLSTSEFLSIASAEGTYKNSGGAGKPDIFASISDPTQAASIITSVFKSELNRDPTAAELAKYTKQLQSAERRNPFKTVDGIRTGGIDKAQFIVGEIQKLPEFAKKKTDKAALTSQSILGTARANGVTLNQAQIDSFAKRVQDGENIKTIDSEIRSIAGLGMPEKVQKLLAQGIDLNTVYSPYKNLMASILEVNPESIDLKDPTLRSAIGPDKEMPIYDFEKALRKDYRWQYTDNAKKDVSNVALKVLKDFGFQA